MNREIETLSLPLPFRSKAGLRRWLDLPLPPQPVLFWGARVLSLVLVLTTWQIAGSRMNPIFLSTPTRIVRALATMILNGQLFTAVQVTALGILLGFALSVIVGVPIGMVMGRSKLVEAVLDPYVNALFVSPRIALIPLILIWFGIGFEAQVVVIFLSSVFPIIISTYSGVKSISSHLVDTARSFCASERQLFREVVLPGSMPFIMSGLRLGIGHAVIGVVVAQMFLSLTGLGKLLVDYGNFFKTDYVLATVIVISSFGILLTWIMRRIEQHFAHWKETERAFS